MRRIFWLDVSRALAILLVVFTHAHEVAGIQNNLLISIFYTIDRLGVPIFFMISGGLILPKLVNVNVFAFYKKRIPQFAILLVFWSVVSNIIRYCAEGKGIYDAIILAFINNNGIIPSASGPAQMWFMYAIIQLYLVAPFLAKMLSKASNKEIIVFVFLCVIFNQFKSTAEFFGGDWGTLHMMGMNFTGAYLLYFILGYLIIERSVFCGKTVKHVVVYVLLILIPSILLVLLDYKSGQINGELHWYHGSLFILLSGVGLFLLFKYLFEMTNIRFLNFISTCSFGIYLTHYAFIYLIHGIFENSLSNMSDIERMMIYFVFPFLGSLLLTYLMMKTKLTRYLIS